MPFLFQQGEEKLLEQENLQLNEFSLGGGFLV